MSEVVERVAEALFYAKHRANPLFDYDQSLEKDEYRHQARAAIAALRVPTEDMVAVGWQGGGATPADSWRAMIDEALK